MTTAVLKQVVWAGANLRSYPQAAEALSVLLGVELSPKQIRRLASAVGNARIEEREAAVQQLRALPLPARRAPREDVAAPDVAVISLDGGRYQRRDHFGQSSEEALPTHWRETKVGCLLSMESPVHQHDPCPDLPEYLAHSEGVAQLAKIAANPRENADPPAAPAAEPLLCEPAAGQEYQPPTLLSREVLASGADIESFGWQLEALAWQQGFSGAPRQAFVSDGAAANWGVQRRHFPHAVPIVDLMHALAYAYAASAAVDGGASYHGWAQLLWQGRVRQVITQLDAHQQRVGEPPPNAPPGDPRMLVHRARTYYGNNLSRMNYPQYRRDGLPLTSSHIESTVKQINQRIKGTEKFWQRDTGEAILQLRADSLSDSRPLDDFWQRWQSQQTGSNRYQTAA